MATSVPAAVKKSPEIVTGVPPVTEPEAGTMESIFGGEGGGRYVKAPDRVAFSAPSKRVIMTSTAPGAAAAGVTQDSVSLSSTFTEVPESSPKRTVMSSGLVNPAPLSSTRVPPASGPEAGLTESRASGA